MRRLPYGVIHPVAFAIDPPRHRDVELTGLVVAAQPLLMQVRPHLAETGSPRSARNPETRRPIPMRHDAAHPTRPIAMKLEWNKTSTLTSWLKSNYYNGIFPLTGYIPLR